VILHFYDMIPELHEVILDLNGMILDEVILDLDIHTWLNSYLTWFLNDMAYD
jgi:hypothetical protein